MIALNLQLDGDNAWPELVNRRVAFADNLSIAGLAGGMQSGRPSVMLRIDLHDNRTVICETSLALFLTAADALRARYGDPREKETP